MPRKTHPATDFEREVLDVVLVELRRAMRLRAQLSIIIDPFLPTGGAHIFAGPNESGHTYTIDTRKRGSR